MRNIFGTPALASMKDRNKGHRFKKMRFVFAATLISDAEFYTNSHTFFGATLRYPSHIAEVAKLRLASRMGLFEPLHAAL